MIKVAIQKSGRLNKESLKLIESLKVIESHKGEEAEEETPIFETNLEQGDAYYRQGQHAKALEVYRAAFEAENAREDSDETRCEEIKEKIGILERLKEEGVWE